jgi:hypothetical protein
MTYGERAVGLTFNPSGDSNVQACKEAFAAIIDNLHDFREASIDPEVKRMCSIAITDAQTSQMWAVKALTWNHNLPPLPETTDTAESTSDG